MKKPNKKKKPLSFKRLSIITAKSICHFILTYTFFVIIILFLFKWIDPPVTSFVQNKSGYSQFFIFQDQEYRKEWVPINKISKYLTLAVIASEDQRFIDHSGFDIEEIKRAIEESGRGKRLRGASTISQQVAKNLFLWPHKSFFRKTLEAYYTFFIELVWSKQRIIEVYLNIAEFGNKIYGVENVAYIHFNKSTININEVEAALIAAVLPNPLKYSINKPSRYLIKRRDRILQQMKLMGGIRVVEKLY